eukprot:TRINITY_DN62057_c0_g1_i1.p1 TRINITY_DN62057_c0_g1~~TRINITY_DN62057_c0_g1_i1.p1  ORF type:complete len:361 (+),score=59.13 TRINITY_DN62057_c0_g1_i1:70-1083(+)
MAFAPGDFPGDMELSPQQAVVVLVPGDKELSPQQAAMALAPGAFPAAGVLGQDQLRFSGYRSHGVQQLKEYSEERQSQVYVWIVICLVIAALVAFGGAVAGVLAAQGAGSLAPMLPDASGFWSKECLALGKHPVRRMWLVRELIPTSKLTSTDFEHWKVLLDTGKSVAKTDLNRRGDLKGGEAIISCNLTQSPVAPSWLLQNDIFGLAFGIHIYGRKSVKVTEFDADSCPLQATLDQIKIFSDSYLKKHPLYDLSSRNCQNYAKELLKKFCKSGVVPARQTVWKDVVQKTFFRFLFFLGFAGILAGIYKAYQSWYKSVLNEALYSAVKESGLFRRDN